MSEGDPIRVAIVDDHAIVRRGLSAILTTTEQLKLVGEAEDGQEAVELCQLAQPDVVLMDLIMPGMDGIQATREIHQRWPHIQVLVLTSFTEQEMIQGALDAGARGYLLKNVKGSELVEAIVEVYRGGQRIAQEAQQFLKNSGQLTSLKKDIHGKRVSTAELTATLGKHLPRLFPSFQVEIHLFPDSLIYLSSEKPKVQIPGDGWQWLHSVGEMHTFSEDQELPWGGRQNWGITLILFPIHDAEKELILGGISLLIESEDSDIDELTNTLKSLANIIAIALEREPEDTEQVIGRLASDELEMAGKLQSRILPEKPPHLDGWDIATRLLPARETSGDFYDFIPLSNNKWGILIADVTDKGLGAAVFMAMCSSLIRTYAVRFPTLPALALSSVNERIFTDMRGGLFLTAFYGILEPETGRLRYVNAGHNPPFLVGNLKGKPLDRLPSTGMALGVSEEATWQQKVLKFSPGDVLVMFTDGITEAQNQGGVFFGDIRLQESIRKNKTLPANRLLETILNEVNEFTRGAPVQDDKALVILSRKI
ncbi:MAG: SpoIIE family protein phosphatase [Chloroflexota bacterium]|nr:MAG: SpoIIE family protein phosphatase [Chloroflexota bacterium]